ncbi:MAG: AAA family ATPase [Bacteroidota bacterium]
MKKLPISIQTFESIVKRELIYVDKTPLIWKLVSKGQYYFFARPRRFGKSLMLTTLKSFFQGRKDLFEGLFIHDKEENWTVYPVIHIDYSLVDYRFSVELFNKTLVIHLKNIAEEYDVELINNEPSTCFTELVNKLGEKYQQQIVVLVDEYDKPMVDLLTKEERFRENRAVLSNLYGAMKALDGHFRFVMLTGVSRFAKVNVFSGMNNLEDISMDDQFATLAGFTQTELETSFADWLELLRQKFEMPMEELLEHIRFWYNGFCFDGVHKLYNPFSILNLFSKLDFGNYWFSSGTPTFLIDLITEQKHLPETFEGIKVADLTGSTSKITNLPLIPLLYQTGYLAIDKTERDGLRKYYYLGYPNEEVRYSFLTYLAAGFVGKDQYEIQPEAIGLRDALREERAADFIKHLQSFFANIPARLHIPQEAYYHSLAYLVLRLVGVHLFLEKETSKGRIDAVLELPDKIYVIEFKFGKVEGRIKKVETLAQNALQQIEERQYHQPYLSSGKKVILFGIGFLEKELAGGWKVL